jgi:hypothetical protein
MAAPATRKHLSVGALPFRIPSISHLPLARMPARNDTADYRKSLQLREIDGK